MRLYIKTDKVLYNCVSNLDCQYDGVQSHCNSQSSKHEERTYSLELLGQPLNAKGYPQVHPLRAMPLSATNRN